MNKDRIKQDFLKELLEFKKFFRTKYGVMMAVLVAGILVWAAYLGGLFAPSANTVKQRVRENLTRMSPRWGEVEWHICKPMLGRYDFTVPYTQSNGVVVYCNVIEISGLQRIHCRFHENDFKTTYEIDPETMTYQWGRTPPLVFKSLLLSLATDLHIALDNARGWGP